MIKTDATSRFEYVNTLVDGMDVDTLAAFVIEHISDYVDSLNEVEFEDWVRQMGLEHEDDDAQ